MNAKCFALISLLLVSATGARAENKGRGAVATALPIEPSTLFAMPTGHVVRSMDLDVSASSVLFGQKSTSPLGRVVLGLGDIAEMQIGTLDLTSDLTRQNSLVNVPAGGLKVYLLLWNYAHGIAASFRRSGIFKGRTNNRPYSGKIGEFYTVVSAANYPMGKPNRAGWNGIKVKAHLGLKYIDANLVTGEEHERSFWRPVGGFEIWRNNARARIVAEMGWAPHFNADGGIKDDRVLVGGVRFFFSKHVSFDIGVRHQGNFGGLAESTIQTRLHMAVPTHALRERLIGI